MFGKKGARPERKKCNWSMDVPIWNFQSGHCSVCGHFDACAYFDLFGKTD
jgi:hypothetical protein